MANRLLRDWTDSETMENLSVYGERLFTRLIMKADDFGVFPANVKLLKSYLFPLLASSIKDSEIDTWLNECINCGLIIKYQAKDKWYLQIRDFGQRLRVKQSKYPLPDDHDSDSFEKNKFGYIYFIGVSLDSPVKIGFSLNPWARLKEVSTGNHEKLEVLLTFKASKKFESELHNAFSEFNIKNEWFQLPEDIISVFVDSLKQTDNVVDLLRSNIDLLRINNEPPELEEKRIEEKVKGPNTNYFLDKSEAFTDLKCDDLYIDECHRVLTGRGWLSSDKVDVVAVISYFLNGKADLKKPRDDIRKHFKNWIIQADLKNLETYASVFKKSQQNGRSTGQAA
jgi:hypothetical protein